MPRHGHAAPKAGMSIAAKLTYLVIGMIVVLMAIGLIKHAVVFPAINKHWLRASKRRYDDDEEEGVQNRRTVGAVVVCNGHADDTERQVAQLLKRAWCAHRVVVVVVQCGPLVASGTQPATSVLKRLARNPLFSGMDDEYSVTEHVVMATAFTGHGTKPVLPGNYVALGVGLRKLRELDVEYMGFFAPVAMPCKHWDRILLTEHALATVSEHRSVVLSYAPSSTVLAAPTYPVMSFVGDAPCIAWTPFNQKLEACHLTKIVSVDFIFLRLADVDKAGTVEMLERLRCAPRCADIVLSQLFDVMGLAMCVPKTPVVQGRFSKNCTRYLAEMTLNGDAKMCNMMETQAVLNILRCDELQPFVAGRLGLDMQRCSARKDAVMGTLPEGKGLPRTVLETDLAIKYQTPSHFASTWEQLRKQLPNTHE